MYDRSAGPRLCAPSRPESRAYSFAPSGRTFFRFKDRVGLGHCSGIEHSGGFGENTPACYVLTEYRDIVEKNEFATSTADRDSGQLIAVN